MWPKCLFLGDQFQPSWNGWETGCKPISWPNLTAFLSLLNTHTHTNCQTYVFIFCKVSHKMKLLLHEIEHPDSLRTSFYTPNKNQEFVYMRLYVTIKANAIIVSPKYPYNILNKKPSYFKDPFAIVTKTLHCHRIAICPFYKRRDTLKAVIWNTTQKVCSIIQLLPYNLTVHYSWSKILCGWMNFFCVCVMLSSSKKKKKKTHSCTLCKLQHLQ